MSDAHDKNYCLAKAEQCFRLARFCTDEPLAARLLELGHEFMAKALELGAVPPPGYLPPPQG
ncbi:MAG TPA: hypothetical protein VGJ20_39045, partial [Xanthobacteraceae bacterium]